MSNKLERKFGLFTAICMVVGIVIGSGVFFKAQTILEKTGGDMPLGILAWIIGGAIMLVCLLTFSQMGQRYERVNGWPGCLPGIPWNLLPLQIPTSPCPSRWLRAVVSLALSVWR